MLLMARSGFVDSGVQANREGQGSDGPGRREAVFSARLAAVVFVGAAFARWRDEPRMQAQERPRGGSQRWRTKSDVGGTAQLPKSPRAYRARLPAFTLIVRGKSSETQWIS